MRRALWIAGILVGIGLIAAIFHRFGCPCCPGEQDEGSEREPEEEQEVPEAVEEPAEDPEEG